MRRLLVLALWALLPGTPAQATTYVGAIDNRTATLLPGIIAQGNAWSGQGLRLSWQVDDTTSPGSWTYSYSLGAGFNKPFALFDIETAGDTAAGEVTATTPSAFGCPGGSTTVIPGTIASAPTSFNAVHAFTVAESGVGGAHAASKPADALSSADLSQYSGDPSDKAHGCTAAGCPGTPGGDAVAHPMFGIRWVFPGTGYNAYSVCTWRVQVVTVRPPMWGSAFAWGDQTSTWPYTYAEFHTQGIDNATRLGSAPASTVDGTGTALATFTDYQGWLLVPGPADAAAPTATATTPAQGATGVSTLIPITAAFSEAMAAGTVSDLTFTVSGVAGTVSYDPATHAATFTPGATLDPGTTYTATLGIGATDIAGNALAAPFTWTFTTATAPDTAPPTVLSMSPAADATDVAVASAITATFSEPMDSATISSSTFLVGGATGTVTYDPTTFTATFTPAAPLAFGTTYSVTVSGVKDLAGNVMAVDAAWTFTTAAAPDTTPPTVHATSPASGSTSVPVDGAITATFSEAMDGATITTSTFVVTGVTGTVSYDPSTFTASFTPDAPLAHDTRYTVTIDTGAKDLAGNALAAPVVWSFSTSLVPYAPRSGDLDGDGRTTTDDAQMALEVAVGNLGATTQQSAAVDVAPLVNGIPHPDGQIDVGDVVVTLRKAAGAVTW